MTITAEAAFWKGQPRHLGPPRDLPPNWSQPLSGFRDFAGVRKWEFYERGGWKPMAANVQAFIDENYHNELQVHMGGMFLDPEERSKYTWDFINLLQHRWHLDRDGIWEIVKTRSIRRVQILAAPRNPVG